MAEPTTVPVAALERVVTAILRARGARSEHAECVADDLVLADRSGVPSHGVARVGEYVQAIDDGRIRLDADVSVVARSPATVALDGGGGFGQVVGREALAQALDLAAASGSGLVVARNSHHIGRIGAISEAGAAAGKLVLAFVAVGIPGPVAPLGGSEGRLGTNPISYGVPAGAGEVVADFATSSMPEGVVNRYRRLGEQLPEGVLVDADGRPTTDPAALYADPAGAILPFGGPWAHRGYALNLMVELFAGTLAGYGPQDPNRPSNCLFLLAVDPGALLPGTEFRSLAGATAEFVTSSAPAPGTSVQVPGGPEAAARQRHRDSVPVDGVTLAGLNGLARDNGVEPLDHGSN